MEPAVGQKCITTFCMFIVPCWLGNCRQRTEAQGKQVIFLKLILCLISEHSHHSRDQPKIFCILGQNYLPFFQHSPQSIALGPLLTLYILIFQNQQNARVYLVLSAPQHVPPE